jgi:hypothetical protein
MALDVWLFRKASAVLKQRKLPLKDKDCLQQMPQPRQ